MFTAMVLEQVKFGKKKKKILILLRPEHTKVSIVYIMRTLPVRRVAFRWDKTEKDFPNGGLKLGIPRLLTPRAQAMSQAQKR